MSSLLQPKQNSLWSSVGEPCTTRLFIFLPSSFSFFFFFWHLEYGLIKIGYVLNFFYLIIFWVLFCGNKFVTPPCLLTLMKFIIVWKINSKVNDLGTSEKDDTGYDIKRKLIKMQIVWTQGCMYCVWSTSEKTLCLKPRFISLSMKTGFFLWRITDTCVIRSSSTKIYMNMSYFRNFQAMTYFFFFQEKKYNLLKIKTK